MSVYTPITAPSLQQLLQNYPLGGLCHFQGITAGTVNSNYFVYTETHALVLTIFETLSITQLHYFMALLKHLKQSALPVVAPIANQAGATITLFEGKPAVLMPKIPGATLEQVTPHHCQQMGQLIAKLHLAGLSFPTHRNNSFDHHWRNQVANSVKSHLTSSQLTLLEQELQYQTAQDYSRLPKGVIHGDGFRDNVLFLNHQLQGLIDFYFACHDYWLIDLAIIVNDWCIEPDGSLNNDKLIATCQSYQAIRNLTPAEIDHWPNMIRAQALRFWLSRLNAKFTSQPTDMILIKDPNHFELLLRYWQANPISWL